ncbi:Transforming growth factor beta-1-induced transcript 1 protein [Geranomyces variabilis]|nr:Transforming growth factor beta-1-induced transcript 1 protein [Geranomyces variabilis]
MVKSAYYSQLPTVRCRDCGQVLDYSAKHVCSHMPPDFAAEQRQRTLRRDQQRNDQQRQQQQVHPPPHNPRGREQHDRFDNDNYSNNSGGGGTHSPRGSPHPYSAGQRGAGSPHPNAYPQDQHYYGGGGADRAPQSPRARSREQQREQRPRRERSRAREPQQDQHPSHQERSRSRPNVDRAPNADRADLANIRTRDLANPHQPRGANSPYPSNTGSPAGSARQSPRSSIDDVMSDLIDELSIDSNGQHRTAAAVDNQSPTLERLTRFSHCKKRITSHASGATLDMICAGCNQQIFEQPVYALGRAWHEHHLRCAACRMPIQGNPFEHEDQVYCSADYASLVAPKCRECGLGIQGETICALDSTFHKECFVCQTCKEPFPDKSFYVVGQDPLCRLHYHERNNSLCGDCGEPIEGPCAEIAELNKRFHPAHWCCYVCRVPLSSTYYSFAGRPYCQHDIMEVYQQGKSAGGGGGGGGGGSKANRRQTLMLDLGSDERDRR